MDAVVDRVLPQEDRTESDRIPILPGIDERLYENRIEGYRYDRHASGPGRIPHRGACIRGDGAEQHSCAFHRAREHAAGRDSQVAFTRQSRWPRKSSGRR